MAAGTCKITLRNGRELDLDLAAEDVVAKLTGDVRGVSEMPIRGSRLRAWIRHEDISVVEETPSRIG